MAQWLEQACETDGRRIDSRPCLKTFNLNFKIQLCPNKNNNNNNNSHHLLGLRFTAAKNTKQCFSERCIMLSCFSLKWILLTLVGKVQSHHWQLLVVRCRTTVKSRFNESRFSVKSRFKERNHVTKMEFLIKKSRFSVKSWFKESKCADGGHSLNRDFTVQGNA